MTRFPKFRRSAQKPLLWLVWALSLFLCLSMPAQADAPLKITASAVLVDAGGKMALGEVRTAENWQALAGPRHAAGYGADTLWFRLHLEGERNGIAILSLRPSFLDAVTFYLPEERAVRGGEADMPGFIAYRQGDLLPLAARIYDLRGFAVPIDMVAGTGFDVYVRLETTSTRLFVANLAWADGFMAALTREAMIGGASYLLILAMLVFAGAQWLRTSQPVYVSHIALAAAIGLFFLARSGDLSLLLPNAPFFAHYAVGVAVCLTLGSLVLSVAHTLPRRGGLALDTWPGRAMAVVVILSVLLSLFGQYERIAGPFAMLIAGSIVYLLVQSLFAREGNRLLRLARSCALTLFLPTGLVNLGLADLYWEAEAALTLGVLSMLVVLVAMAWRDDSQRRQAHAAALIEAGAARLETSLKEKAMRLHRQWVAIFSHEIKTPLAIIEASRSNIGRLAPAPDVAERTEKIGRAVGAINGLVDVMLAADELESRIEAAETQDCALAPVLEAALPPENRARITLTCPTGLTVKADAALLGIALSNLVTNALQHGLADTPIAVTAEAQGNDGARIHVSSAGAALPAGMTERLFEKHFRSADSAGHGIGLWAVAAIAERHGGGAAYARTRGGHNRFTLWFEGSTA